MGRHDELMGEIRQLVQPWLDELRRTITSSQTVNERGAHRVSCPAAASPAGKQTTLVSNELKGYSFRETTGAGAATVVLRDGSDATADPVAEIALAAGASATVWFGETGIALVNGCYVDRVAGTSEGAVYLRSGGAS